MEWTADTLAHGRMSNELLDQILTELAAHRDDLVSVEPYLNNEPFMDRRFVDVLRRVRSFAPSVELSTNATLMVPETSDVLLDEHLVDDFRISIFGSNRENYEGIMQRLSWESMTENVEYYARGWLQRGKPNLSRIVYVYNPDIQDPGEFALLRSRWQSYGLGFIHWGQLDRVGNVPHPRSQLELRSRRGRVVNCKMGYMRDRISIHYDGSVYLCCQDWSRSRLIGSLANTSIAGLWASEERTRNYRQIYGMEETPTGHLCRDCELATIADSAARPIGGTPA